LQLEPQGKGESARSIQNFKEDDYVPFNRKPFAGIQTEGMIRRQRETEKMLTICSAPRTSASFEPENWKNSKSLAIKAVTERRKSAR
jgi:hypothetical protein